MYMFRLETGSSVCELRSVIIHTTVRPLPDDDVLSMQEISTTTLLQSVDIMQWCHQQHMSSMLK